MTLEQRVEKLEQQVLNLQAALYVRTAETQSLLALLRLLDTALRAVIPSPQRQTQRRTFDETFLAQRKAALQQLLTQLEQTDPALAARLSEQLESPALNFPVDWD